MNCITKLNILLRLTNPDTIFVLYAAIFLPNNTSLRSTSERKLAREQRWQEEYRALL